MTMLNNSAIECEKERIRRSGGKMLNIDSQENGNSESNIPFTFSSQPRALYTSQTISTGRVSQQIYSNLMFEKRIFRGSNYAQTFQTSENESALSRTMEARRRALVRRKAQKKQIRGHDLRLKSPPPVAGRKHEPVQTDLYLEEIWCNPPVVDVYIQTDLFCDRPASPFYVMTNSGVDIETQIYPGDLFDFDLEVQPVLEVLVNKTIEQSLVEVLEEDELSNRQIQKQKFLESMKTENVDHASTKTDSEEVTDIKDSDLQINKVVTELIPEILRNLEETGCSSCENLEINKNLTSWLTNEVTLKLQNMVCREDVVKDIIENVLKNYLELHGELFQPEN